MFTKFKIGWVLKKVIEAKRILILSIINDA